MNDLTEFDQIGPYRIVAELSRRRMATVYHCHDERGQDVAVKVFSPQLAHSEGFVVQLQETITAVSHLRHPHIALILQAGEAGNYFFVALPLYKGGTLQDKLIEDGAAPVVLWQTLEQVAAALDAAHAVGIVHRDVKPSNILFDEQGNAFLADFGLAEIQDTTIHATGLPGNLLYMTPEQFTGDGISDRTDQYSLAIIAYEMLTGRPPFQGNMTQLMYSHTHTPPPLAEVKPARAAAPLARALAKQGADRFETTTDFVAALKQAVLLQPGPGIPNDPSATFVYTMEDLVELDRLDADKAAETAGSIPTPIQPRDVFDPDPQPVAIKQGAGGTKTIPYNKPIQEKGWRDRFPRSLFLVTLGVVVACLAGAIWVASSQGNREPNQASSAITATHTIITTPISTDPIRQIDDETGETAAGENGRLLTLTSTSTSTALPTRTPTLTAVIAPSATPTRTATPTLTPTDTPTATAPAAPFIPPINVTGFSCNTGEVITYKASSTIEFTFNWASTLESSQYLEIRVGPRGNNTTLTSIGRVPPEHRVGNTWTLTTVVSSFYNPDWRDYHWQVHLMQPTRNTSISTSARRCFSIGE